jgi:hypothetical protein
MVWDFYFAMPIWIVIPALAIVLVGGWKLGLHAACRARGHFPGPRLTPCRTTAYMQGRESYMESKASESD